ncbi:MAG: ribbon-helix-helix domain-containing protein [Candidatus Altiarchaeota archaeon]
MSYKIAICVRIDGELMKRFDKVAKGEGYDRSEAVREAIRRFIKER